MRRSDAIQILALAALLAAPLLAADDPEPVRRFFEDGPASLAPVDEVAALADADTGKRAEYARTFLARDPDPTTPENELEQAIAARRELVLDSGYSFFDARGRLLFLRGRPSERKVVECGQTYRPLEIWSWGSGDGARPLVLVQPNPSAHFVAWRPTDSKRGLYQPEMEYLLEEIYDYQQRGGSLRMRKRPDRYFCDDSERVDEVTGIDGLFGFKRDRMKDADVDALFAPPADLAAWARAALAGAPQAAGKRLPEPELAVHFPEAKDQRLLARFRLTLPAGTELGVVEADGGKEVRVALDGVLERPDVVFEEFHTRFVFQPPAPGTPVVLEAERLLRPHAELVARLTVRDEVSGARVVFDRAFTVPKEAAPEPEEAAAPAIAGKDLGLSKLGGRDTIVLLPPVDDVVFGLWRAEALVAGERIKRVAFLLDGKTQMTRGAPPWTAEMRLPAIPDETIVRVEGLDAAGKVVAADELLLNEPRGEPKVKLLAPPRGRVVRGPTKVRAAVVVPEGRRVESVEFRLNDALVAKLGQPPWEATVDVPESGEVTYLTVTALYDDGSRVEDFRMLNSADFVEEIRVDLVELYVTVTDRDGRLAEDLTADDFRIRDNGREQKVARFELVRDLPLTLGLTLDTSGSMGNSMAEAKRAATGFLSAVMTPRDRCFVVGFAERPSLLMPLTSDAMAVEAAFRDLPAIGNTSLHDALVYSLYQFRGIRGRKALVLLSDGDDSSSLVTFEDALAFAQRSGVAIYTIGLDIGKLSLGIRDKLDRLATETGGRTFYIERAAELASVYGEIERELRSQYFLAFAPDPAPKEGERHTLDVEAHGGKLKARTARGYTP